MGFFSRLLYATLVSKEVRQARMIDELRKINRNLEKNQRLTAEHAEMIRQAYKETNKK